MADHGQTGRVGNSPEAYGVWPKQAIKEFEALYTQAGEPQTKEYLTQAGDAIAAKLREKFPGLFDDTSFAQGNLKGNDRAVIKLLGSKGNALDAAKAEEIFDLRRGRIVIDNADQVRAIRMLLSDDKQRAELGIEHAHDRFANPSSTHYRDINMSVRLPNGHVAEIQINQRDMLAAGEFTHDAYEDADTRKKSAQIEWREPFVAERVERELLTNYARDVHDLGAKRFEGADDLLNDAGRARLARDFAKRREADPTYEPGKTVQTGHKYDDMLENGLPPLDKAEAYGGEGAKALRIKAGIEVYRLPMEKLDWGGIRRSSLLEVFGRHAGMIGIVLVPVALAVDGADAQEIGLGVVEAAVPFASAAVAANEKQFLEAALRSVEEIPLAGVVLTEFIRPPARHLGGAKVDASIGETILSMASDALNASDGEDELQAVFEALPDKVMAGMPPEIESLVEFKRLVVIAEQKRQTIIADQTLRNAEDTTALDSATIELARFQRLFADQYNELAADGGGTFIMKWIDDNSVELPTPTFTPPANETAAGHHQRAPGALAP